MASDSGLGGHCAHPVSRDDRLETFDTAGGWSTWSVAFQIRLNNFASVPQQIKNGIVGSFGFPAAVSKPSCYYVINNNYRDRMSLVKRD